MVIIICIKTEEVIYNTYEIKGFIKYIIFKTEDYYYLHKANYIYFTRIVKFMKKAYFSKSIIKLCRIIKLSCNLIKSVDFTNEIVYFIYILLLIIK